MSAVDRDRPSELFEAYLRRVEGGESIDFSTYCEEHPHCASELRNLKRAHELVDGTFPQAGGLLEELCTQYPDIAHSLRIVWQQVRDGAIQAPKHPEKIGQFRILNILGEGGMGTVYLAEQKDPVRRRVALKVIKLGMDSKRVLARFDAERQALAMMNHDAIARVFEMGTTDTGQPYFVMEYAPGLAITDYCDRNRLSLEERVRLFQQVCAGVQHAHQKGIIHRDLKPSNVLITDREGTPAPKIIDFGLARATDHRLLQQTLYTEIGQIVGTVEYMSPEQASPTNADIDTRTDVYALGVILHELLVGALPFPELGSYDLLEKQRVIKEDEPARPSARLRSSPDCTAIAASLGTNAKHLLQVMRGDLDWVLLKALEKDRNRRYESAAALASDLDRFLRMEPVEAGPPSAAYRVRKLARRYRLQLVSLACIFGALVFGLITAVFYYRNAKANEIVAKNRGDELEALNAELEETNSELVRISLVERRAAEKFKLMKDTYKEVLTFLPEAARWNDQHFQDSHDMARQKLDGFLEAHLKGNPVMRGEALYYRGVGYTFFGALELAGNDLKETLAIRRAHPSAESRDLGETLISLAYLNFRGEDLDSAEEMAREAFSLFAEDENSVGEHTALSLLARIAFAQGRFAQSIDYAESAIEIDVVAKERLLETHTLHALATVGQGDPEKSKLTIDKTAEAFHRKGIVPSKIRGYVLVHLLSGNKKYIHPRLKPFLGVIIEHGWNRAKEQYKEGVVETRTGDLIKATEEFRKELLRKDEIESALEVALSGYGLVASEIEADDEYFDMVCDLLYQSAAETISKLRVSDKHTLKEKKAKAGRTLLEVLAVYPTEGPRYDELKHMEDLLALGELSFVELSRMFERG